METQRDDIELVDWDGNTRENTPDVIPTPVTSAPPPSESTYTLSLNDDSENDSECPKAPLGHKGIKILVSDITKLYHDSNLA